MSQCLQSSTVPVRLDQLSRDLTSNSVSHLRLQGDLPDTPRVHICHHVNAFSRPSEDSSQDGALPACIGTQEQECFHHIPKPVIAQSEIFRMFYPHISLEPSTDGIQLTHRMTQVDAYDPSTAFCTLVHSVHVQTLQPCYFVSQFLT